MTLKELIRALEKISKENPEIKDEFVYCQVGPEIIHIDELNINYRIRQNTHCVDFASENGLTEEDKAKNPRKVLVLS